MFLTGSFAASKVAGEHHILSFGKITGRKKIKLFWE
jgi:hypothetical protein